MKKIPIIAVVGPTASGKTDLAIALAKRLGAEIISFDSMQIYKGMHVASAAPDEAEKDGVPHHLLEFLDADCAFSVADFVLLARKTANEIVSRGKPVIIVGGTGLYVSSFIDNVIFSEEKVDEALRLRLNAEYDAIGGEAMLERLREFDPQTANRLHPNNKKRVIRAFEIYLSTGTTMSAQMESSKAEESPYMPYMLGITFKNRDLLYEKINLRVNKMLENGLLKEAESAFKVKNGPTACQAIGHKEFFPFFEGKISLEEAVENLKAETRRYAKRQLTWFRKDERINWIYRDECESTFDSALEILERIGYFGKI